MIITQNEYLKEPSAADSLKAAQETKPTTTAAARALEVFMKLAPEQQKLHLDFLEKSLNGDNDAWNKATDYSERNRASLKDAQKTKTMPTLKKEELEELIAESFPEFSPELQNKFAELFASSVGALLRQKILELFVDYPEFALVFGDKSMDHVESLLLRISDLEDGIADVEEENEMLEAGLVESQQQRLSEEALFATQQHKRARSLDFDDYLDPENSRLMDEQQQQRATDPAMAARLRYIEASIPANAGEHAVQGLLETWDLNNKN